MKMQKQKENKMMMEMYEMINTLNVVPAPGDPDHHFARIMKMHHEGAIRMAEIELNEGCDVVIKKMAQSIIHKQKEDIAQLESFLETYIPGTANFEFNIKMEICMEKMDQDGHLKQVNGSVDHDFATMMIAHHQSTIAMTDLIIHYGYNQGIQRLAREIKEDQEMETAAFQRWLNAAAGG